VAKEPGITSTISVDDSGGTLRDISNDVLSFSVGTPNGLLDVTGVDKSAMERLIGLSDGTVQLTVAFNDAASTGSHTVFKTRTGTRTFTWAQSGQTLSMEMLIGEASWARGADGSLIGTIGLSLQSGTVPVWT
jgi:hypothetical protein